MNKTPVLELLETSVNPNSGRGAATYAGQIIAKVREALFLRKLKEGDFLGSEKDLAREFGVSRVTARDALRTLEAMGIVEIRVGAGGGARIAPGNPEKFGDALAIQLCLIGASEAEIMDVQIILEERAAELAAINRTEADVQKIADLVTEAKANIDNPMRFKELCHEFHLGVAVAAHNRVMDAQLKALHFVLWPNLTQNVNEEMAARVLAIHMEIADAIKAGDASAAKSAMSAHLGRIAQSNQLNENQENMLSTACC